MTGQEGGPWRGTNFNIKEISVYQLVEEEKLAKTPHIIQKWLWIVMSDTPLGCKELMSDKVFLVYAFDTHKIGPQFCKPSRLYNDRKIRA